MAGENRHEMKLQVTHPTGAEEWYCPTCGRRFVVQWEPGFNKVVLEQGDPRTPHSGSKGGIHLGAMHLHKAETESVEEQEQDPTFDGLEDINFDDL